MAEYKKEIAFGSVLAILVVMALASAVIYLPLGQPNSSSNGRTLVTTQEVPSNFSVSGEIPYLVVSPQNNTFVLTYSVTAYNYSLNLSYDQAYSYAVQYSNGTQWLSTSRPCQTGGTNSVPSSNTSSYTSTTAMATTGIPCGSSNGEWYPVNGTVILPHLDISASYVQLSIQPTSVPAHATQQIQVRVSIEMHPGMYAINLAMDIQAQGSSRPVQYLLGYMPLIVKG